MVRLGIYGCGKMGGIILEGILKSGICAETDIFVCETSNTIRNSLNEKFASAHYSSNDEELLGKAEYILVCVKPKMVGEVLARIKASGNPNAIVVSIAAGVTLPFMRQNLLPSQGAIRVMPNTPLQVGAGMSSVCGEGGIDPKHLDFVTSIFNAQGRTIQLQEETLFDVVTALAGSGPGLILTLLEGLSDGGVLLGLSREQSLMLAAQTMLGTAKMYMESGLHPAVLRDQVTTPGGCTIAGCIALEDRGVRSALARAIQATAEKAAKLNS